MMQMVTIAPQTQVSVHVHGQKGDIPVIFLNGYGAYQQIWAAQIACVRELGYRMVTWDYRGQGESTGTIAPDLHMIADDLATLIQLMSLENPILVGHSMGASVAWAFARYHPEIPIRGRLTIDQSPKMLNDAAWHYGFKGLTEDNSMAFAQLRSQKQETLHGLNDMVFQRLQNAKNQAPFAPAAAQLLLRDHLNADWRSVVVQSSTPALFVSAVNSPYFPMGYDHWCAMQNSHIHTVRLANTGHDIMAEVPTAFNQTLRHFCHLVVDA